MEITKPSRFYLFLFTLCGISDFFTRAAFISRWLPASSLDLCLSPFILFCNIAIEPVSLATIAHTDTPTLSLSR